MGNRLRNKQSESKSQQKSLKKYGRINANRLMIKTLINTSNKERSLINLS